MQRLLAVSLLSFVTTIVTTFAHAAEDAASRLNQVLLGLSSMQADFAQQTSDGKGRVLQSQTGTMSVKRPGLFRWETLKPSNQLVTTNGNVRWIYDPELMQATKQQLDTQVGNTPALLLSGDPRKLNESFVISEEQGGKGEQVFLLKPRAKDALFDHLKVRFKGTQLLQMALADSLGQKTDIRFLNVKVNPSLSAKLFEFTPPKGVDVIDEI